MNKEVSIPMVKVIYHSLNVAKHKVYGVNKLFGGRSLNYGWRKPGDVFEVAEKDVISKPQEFYAYPCDEPFRVEGGKLVNPCGKVQSVEKVGGNLTDIPGVGPRVAQKFLDVGLDTQEKIAKNLTEELMQELQLPPMSRNKLREWLESQTV